MSRCGLCVCVFYLKNKALISCFSVRRYFVKHQIISHNIWCFSNRILRKQMMLLRSYLGFSIFTLLGSRWAASAWSVLWCCQSFSPVWHCGKSGQRAKWFQPIRAGEVWHMTSVNKSPHHYPRLCFKKLKNKRKEIGKSLQISVPCNAK